MKIIIVPLLLLVFITGCAEIDIPSPRDVLKRPLGTDSVKVGMAKDQVKELWGDPDYVNYEEAEGSNRAREVWVYKGRYSSVPVDAGYLSKTRHLYFDGNNLTKISE